VNIALGDGSVRFIGSSVDQRIHWAIHSRDGGETYSHDQL
jgi:hypothetical protein